MRQWYGQGSMYMRPLGFVHPVQGHVAVLFPTRTVPTRFSGKRYVEPSRCVKNCANGIARTLTSPILTFNMSDSEIS